MTLEQPCSHRAADDTRPLALFTSLAIMGAGAAATQPLFGVLGPSTSVPGKCEVALPALLVGAGLAVSLLHVGRKERMLLAMRRLGRSPLSSEVALAVLLMAGALLSTILHNTTAAVTGWLTAAAGMALLVCIGQVYNLRGQLNWRGTTALAPIATGLLWGSLVHVLFSEGTTHATGAIVHALFAADVLALELRRRQLASRSGTAVVPHFLLLDLLPWTALQMGRPLEALVAATIGILCDRYTFYALKVQHTTEAEIARIEAILRDDPT